MAFRLSDKFLEQYKTAEVPWGTVGYVTYKRTYARRLDEFEPGAQGTEEWWQTCRRVIEGMIDMQRQHVDKLGLEWNNAKAQKTAKDAYDRLFNLKWTPPGRGLWMAGTEFVKNRTGAGLFNCFKKDTKFFAMSDDIEPVPYLASFHDFSDGDVIDVPVLKDGAYTVAKATIRSYGEQQLQQIVFRYNWGTSEYRFWHEATANHRWILEDGSETTNLKVGDVVKITPLTHQSTEHPHYNEGFAHGLVFGDGYQHNKYTNRHMIRLCSDRDQAQLARLEALPVHRSTVYCASNDGDPFVTLVTDDNNVCQDWKSVPTTGSPEYLKGFLDGWLCADSWQKPSGAICLDTQSWEATQWLLARAPLMGYTVRGWTRDDRDTNLGPRSAPLNRITLAPEASTYKVEKITTTSVEEVWCLEVEGEQRFTLGGGLVTGNCAFRSTEKIEEKGAYLFRWMMDALMLGIGVGFDTKGAGKLVIKKPGSVFKTAFVRDGTENALDSSGNYVIADSREGWVDSVESLLNSFYAGYELPVFDYSRIRAYGTPIKGFGGTSSGYGPLKELHDGLTKLYQSRVGEPIRSIDIVDTENLIGRCVVAGNVRRSAALALGQPEDTDYLVMKDPTELNSWRQELAALEDPQGPRAQELLTKINTHPLSTHRWGSNNSIEARVGMDYEPFAQQSLANGEPGYIWLQNAREYGRMKDPARYDDMRVMGFNPCVEQQLEDAELCCVSGDTRILTKTGYPRIRDVVGEEVEVWNGKAWSKTIPFLAGREKKLYRVHLSDGSYLDATNNHEWSARNPSASKFKRLRTDELKVGMRVESFELSPATDGQYDANAYRLGWFTGDGFMDGRRPLALVQETEYSILPVLGGVAYPEQKPPGYNQAFRRVNLSGLINEDLGRQLRNSDAGLPGFMFHWDAAAILEFIGGWIDTDGCVRQNPNTDHYIISSTSEQKLRDAQMLLRRAGINHATIQKWQNAGTITNKGMRNKTLWCLLIPSFECAAIGTVIKRATRIGSRYQINNAHPNGGLIDQAQKQKIVLIEELPDEHDTFCFTEPVRHMGVFGNVLTYQCLTETFPARHDSYEDYQQTLKVAYLYAKTVTLSNTHWPETNAIMLKNRRIGLSMSGIVQAMNRWGRRQFYNWCDSAYNYVQELDGIYSDWLCIPRSKRMTSIKPSGTVSLLVGATPGMHFPEDEYYIRRIRFAQDSDMLPALQAAGFPVEDCKYSPLTKVVSFPVKEENFVKGKREVSMWEQLEIAAGMQYYWADNSVSVTITFKPEEGEHIADALALYETRLKAVSFLRYQETGYVQAPYEPITKEEYESMASSIQTVQRFDTSFGGAGTKFCDGDACEIAW